MALGVGLIGFIEGLVLGLTGNAGLDGAIAIPALPDPMIAWVIENWRRRTEGLPCAPTPNASMRQENVGSGGLRVANRGRE